MAPTSHKLLFAGAQAVSSALTVLMCLRPDAFWMAYVALVAPMWMFRLVSYGRKHWNYFLWDYCYFANGLVLVHLLVWPGSRTLMKLAFSSSFGPLAWATVAWRNSTVWHDVDKLTSVFIHLAPPVVMWCQRWFGTPIYACGQQGLTDPACLFGWSDVVAAVLFYMAWQAVYFIKTEVVDAAFLSQNPEVMTSMRWLSNARTGTMYRATRWVARRIGLLAPNADFHSDSLSTKVTFMVAQLVYTAFTMAPVPLLYASFGTSLFILIAWTWVVMYNGSSFYFEVFARRYVKEVEHVSSCSSASDQDSNGSRHHHHNGHGGDMDDIAARFDPDAAPAVTRSGDGGCPASTGVEQGAGARGLNGGDVGSSTKSAPRVVPRHVAAPEAS